MSSDPIEQMKAAFKKARDAVMFKGKAIDEIERIAITTVVKVESAWAEDKLQQKRWHDSEEKSHEKEVLSLTYKIEHLNSKLNEVIEKSNQARKQAAARGNRHKMRYENLLDDIDSFLPGAKELLTSKALLRAEKARKLARLNNDIREQKKRVAASVHPLSSQYGTTKLHERNKKILKALLSQREKIKQLKSY